MNLPVVTIDFETFYSSTYSLRKLSVPEYVGDPRFKAHGLAVRWPDGKLEFRTDIEQVLLEMDRAFGPRWEKAAVLGHNLSFDAYILAHRYGRFPRRLICTKFLSYAIHGRKDMFGGQVATLKALAELYGLPAKGSLEQFSGVWDLSPEQLVALSEYAIHDVELTYELFLRMKDKITNPRTEYPLMAHTIRLASQHGLHVDLALLSQLRGEVTIQRDEALKAARIMFAGLTQSLPLEGPAFMRQVSGNKFYHVMLEKALQATGRSVPTKLSPKGNTIPATSKKDPQMLELLEDQDSLVRLLAEARVEVRSSAQTLAKLERIEKMAKAGGGLIPVELAFHGASTGRWSAAGGVNFQNLPRSGPNARMRELFEAGPGRTFVVSDYSAVEARVLAWVAGEEDLVEGFRQGRDIYSEFAAKAFAEPAGKPKNDTPTEKRKGDLRQIGKMCILGCGYSLGAKKLLQQLQGRPETAPMFANGILSPKRCAQLIRAYRETYPAIKQFWADLETAARSMADGAQEAPVGRACFKRDPEESSVVLLRLPSSRCLRYPGLRLEPGTSTRAYLDEEGEEQEFTSDNGQLVYGPTGKQTTYGGKLAENCWGKKTLVLSSEGGIPISEVTPHTRLWDGQAWVTSDGAVCRGEQEVGTWLGQTVTPEHRILVGSTWQPVSALHGSTTLAALWRGRALAPWSSFSQVWEAARALYADVIAAVNTGWTHAGFGGQKTPHSTVWSAAGSVLDALEPLLASDRRLGFLPNYSAHGRIAIRAPGAGAVTLGTRLGRIMAGEESVCFKSGWMIPRSSSPTSSHSPDTTSLVCSLTGLTMIEVMSLATCGWYPRAKTSGTVPAAWLSGTKAKAIPFWSSGIASALYGAVPTPLTTIWGAERVVNGSWNITGAREEVWDLKNCGPRHRYTVLTPEGPILAHNCTQAIARDLLGEALLESEAAGVEICMHVHDELIARVDAEKVEDAAPMLVAMQTPPAWAAGLPLTVEFHVAPRYGKG